MIGDDEHAVLTDFGLSIAIDDIRSRSTASKHTSTSQGTLRWMAPECLEGGPSTKAADIYAFGITVWEVSTFVGFPIDQRSYVRAPDIQRRGPVCKH